MEGWISDYFNIPSTLWNILKYIHILIGQNCRVEWILFWLSGSALKVSVSGGPTKRFVTPNYSWLELSWGCDNMSNQALISRCSVEVGIWIGWLCPLLPFAIYQYWATTLYINAFWSSKMELLWVMHYKSVGEKLKGEGRRLKAESFDWLIYYKEFRRFMQKAEIWMLLAERWRLDPEEVAGTWIGTWIEN